VDNRTQVYSNGTVIKKEEEGKSEFYRKLGTLAPTKERFKN
jgi:hypothetical protein